MSQLGPGSGPVVPRSGRSAAVQLVLNLFPHPFICLTSYAAHLGSFTYAEKAAGGEEMQPVRRSDASMALARELC